jgi:pyruvate dehydrogenase E2 component (dihydrolipoamide acetyltransferase)
MARIEVPMPQMGESIAEGTVSVWLKKVGDEVERDEPIMEISTDKVDAEIPSPAAGTLVEIVVQEGETVEVGTVVAYIETDATPPTPAPRPRHGPSARRRAGDAGGAAAARSSPLVRRIAAEHGVELESLQGSGRGPGDQGRHPRARRGAEGEAPAAGAFR